MEYSQTIHSTHPPDSCSIKNDPTLPVSEEPPSLGYDIVSRKRSIIISSLGIIVTNGITPAVLFYALAYGTNISKATVINIVEILTTLTLIQWPWRLWKLLRKGGERAPRDRTVFTLDNFQWNFLIGAIPVTICCVFASIKESMRWYMFGPVFLFGQTALQFVVTWFLARAKVPCPFRMSSVQAGEPTRPALYFLVEDLTACDGAGGQDFRDRLNVRWKASLPFRQLFEDLTLYIGLGFLAQTIPQIVVLFTTQEIVFVAVSTFILWGWCGLSAIFAISYTKRALQEEKLWWAENYKNRQLSGISKADMA